MESLTIDNRITAADQELYDKAVSVNHLAYAPYSKFRVSAALLAKNGQVYTGVNVENGAYGAVICAERTACVKAVSEGVKEFSAIAVVSSEGEAWPCGICRQFLYEFGGDLRVITGKDRDHLRCLTLNELLPEGFRL